MTEPEWIDARSACALLGVRAQTLYAYASRALVRVQSDRDDARRSLYARADILALLARHRRPRARAEVARAAIRWGDPVLSTSVSDIGDGQLRFAGRPAEDCAQDMSCEDIAAHLCAIAPFSTPVVAFDGGGGSALGRVLSTLSARAATAAPMQGRPRAEIGGELPALLAGVTDAMLGRAGEGAVHLRFRAAWGLDTAATDAVRRALVLLSDHELNPSTFAVRVCASTGASLPAALLAGMATLSGPRHGGVAVLAREALQAARRGQFGAFLSAHPGVSPYGFGFGHPLYPDGDIRARCLLDALPAQDGTRAAVGAAAADLGLAPNIDAALAALAECHALPATAAFAIFGVGRMAGWAAHAIEQAQSGEIIRPRARYAAPCGAASGRPSGGV